MSIMGFDFKGSFINKYFKDTTSTDTTETTETKNREDFNKNIKEMKNHLNKIQERLNRRKDEILP